MRKDWVTILLILNIVVFLWKITKIWCLQEKDCSLLIFGYFLARGNGSKVKVDCSFALVWPLSHDNFVFPEKTSASQSRIGK